MSKDYPMQALGKVRLACFLLHWSVGIEKTCYLFIYNEVFIIGILAG